MTPSGISNNFKPIMASLYGKKCVIVAARALATYLIPGCVGLRVRLGSESSSGGGGIVWKSGNLEILEFGDLGIWRSGDLEIQKFADLGTWKSRNVGSKNK